MRAGCDTIFCTQAAAQCAEQRTEEADAMMRKMRATGVFKEVSIVRDQINIEF